MCAILSKNAQDPRAFVLENARIICAHSIKHISAQGLGKPNTKLQTALRLGGDGAAGRNVQKPWENVVFPTGRSRAPPRAARDEDTVLPKTFKNLGKTSISAKQQMPSQNITQT